MTSSRQAIECLKADDYRILSWRLIHANCLGEALRLTSTPFRVQSEIWWGNGASGEED